MFRVGCSVLSLLGISDIFLGLVECLTALTAADGEEEKTLKGGEDDWKASTPSASGCGPFVSCSYWLICLF